MAKPFFDMFADTQITVRGDEKPKLKKNREEKSSSCEECGLFKECVSTKTTYTGEGERKILVVSDFPSKQEDESGILGRGPAYELLRDTLKSLGVYVKQDCWYTTAVNCRPRGGRYPAHTQVSTCRARLISLIDTLKPALILMLGEIPFKSLISPRMVGRIAGTQWTMFLGDVIPDQAMGRYLAPVSDASYLLERKTWEDGQKSKPLYEREPGQYLIWKQQLERAINHPSQFYRYNYQGDCLSSTHKDEAIEWLEKALDWKHLALDFETTGLKPHRQGHRIVCASISDGLFSYSFPFFEDKDFRRAWKRLMLSDVKKIGHNMQFENMWNHALLGYYIENWEADTMLLAHAVHSTKPTNLKYLTYSYFGDIGYDDDVDMYLKAPERELEMYGDNAFNLIEKAPLDKLLTYNALDSLYTFKLWEEMSILFDDEKRRGNKFFLDSAITLCKAQENGFYIDEDVLRRNRIKLQEEMKDIEDEINHMDEVKLWDSDEPFSFQSNQQLAHLLFDIEKIKPLGYTKSGAPSVDKENLPKYNTPLVKKVLEWRSLEKITQYLDAYITEAVDKKIHPFFRLSSVDSFRSGASSPNVQQCFPLTTEILTEKGWMTFSAVREYDGKIAQFSEQGNVVSFTDSWEFVPGGIQPCVRVATREQIDMVLTANHQCLLQDRKTNEWRKREASKYPADHNQYHSGYLVQGAPSIGIPLLRLCVALQADGSVAPYGWDFSFHRERKITRFISILEDLGIKYSKYVQKSGLRTRFYLSFAKNPDLRVLSEWKYFDIQKIIALSSAEREVFNEEIMLWDGCSTRKNTYCSKVRANVEAVQLSYALAGRRARLYPRNGSWEVSLGSNGYSMTTNRKIIEVGDILVACVSVPTENIMIRQNGQIYVTGNCPKRNKLARKYIRTGLKPHPGHRLVEHDHGQLEVRINACYSGDRNLIRYVTEGLDMHTESTMEAFLLTKDQMKKDYRNEIKGSFVFAEFYGSYYAQVAKDLWEFVETDEWLKGHLAEKGVKQYVQFEEQIKEAERILWTVRFPEHAEWRKDMWSFYNRHGYIETFTGFRIQGPMRRNNSFNGQVQGSAYHVLQQGMNWTMEEVEQKLEQTKLLVEIHDAMVATVPLHEEDMYDSIVYRNCTKKVVDKWPWIVVPLVMEKERSEVDGNWAEMTSCGVLHD